MNQLLVNINRVEDYTQAEVSQSFAALADEATRFIRSGEVDATLSELRATIRSSCGD